VALIVIDTDTWSRGISSNSSSRSAMEFTGTPTLPTSAAASGSSESKPSCVGRSKAVDSPVCPPSSSSRKRSLVARALEKPAYWRMVHSRPRYIVGWTPRVYGYSPGHPPSGAGP